MGNRITQSEIDARRGIKPGVNASDAAKREYHKYTVLEKRRISDAKLQKQKAADEQKLAGIRGELSAQGKAITDQAGALRREDFGLGEADLMEAAKRRADIYGQQQGSLIARQGAQSRDVSEALQRRLAGGGLTGTGTAERLAQVQNRQLSEIQGQQVSDLQLGQAELEQQARGQEQQAVIGVESFIKNAQINAQTFATQLEAAGVDAERARQFSATEQEKARAFQETVLLPIQQGQWKEQFKEGIRQFEEQLKRMDEQFEFDKYVTKFNMDLAESEANKKGFLDQIFSAGNVLNPIFMGQGERASSALENLGRNLGIG